MDTKAHLPSEQNVNVPKALAFIFVPLMIGSAIAFATYTLGNTDKYNAKIDVIIENDTVWLYLALIILGRTIAFLNSYATMKYKKSMKGNVRANPFIYKVIGENAPKNVSVVFEEDGDVGKYNRANRSVHHMIENFGGFVASLYAAGSVFPFPVFVLVCLFCVGRVLHQRGYTAKFGGHGPGFMISMLAMSTVEGLLLVIVMKSM